MYVRTSNDGEANGRPCRMVYGEGGGMAVEEERLEERGRSVCDELLSGGLAYTHSSEG